MNTNRYFVCSGTGSPNPLYWQRFCSNEMSKSLSPDGVEDFYSHDPPYGYKRRRERHDQQDKSHTRGIRGLGEEIGGTERELEGMAGFHRYYQVLEGQYAND